MPFSRCHLACFWLALPSLVGGLVWAADEPISLGSRRELFVDSLLVDRLQGATIELCQPIDRGSVLALDQPWEGIFSAYTTLIRDGERLRMYYRGGPRQDLTDGTDAEVTCYAESVDGVQWTKPKLGLFEVAGTRENNVVLAGMAPASHNFTPLLDTRPDVPRDERYKALAYSKAKGDFVTLSAWASPDGIHWRKLREEPVMTAKNVAGDWAFDSQNVAFWSPSEQRYVCYFRKFTVDVRTVSRVTSQDFLHWSSPEPMRYSDTGTTRPANQLYTNQTQPYFRAAHLRGDPRAVHGGAESRHRRRGQGPRCSSRVLQRHVGCRADVDARRQPIRLPVWPSVSQARHRDAELGLANQLSGAERHRDRADGNVAVRAVRLRPEIGPCAALHAPPGWIFIAPRALSGGELLTKPLTFSGSKLLLNFATSAAGDVRVEIQDADGKPLPGFSLDDAGELIGNEIARSYFWKASDDVSSLSGKPVRLRFVLRDADLFSFRFQ